MAKEKFLRDLREMSVNDLKKKVTELEASYLEARCNNQIGKLRDKSEVKRSRRRIATAKTILGQRQTAG